MLHALLQKQPSVISPDRGQIWCHFLPTHLTSYVKWCAAQVHRILALCQITTAYTWTVCELQSRHKHDTSAFVQERLYKDKHWVWFLNRRWMNHMDGLLSHTLFIKSQMHTSHSYKTQPVIFSVLWSQSLLLNQNFCSGCDVHFSAAHQQKPFLQFQVYFSQGRLCISRGIKCNSLHVRSSHAKLGSRPALSAPAESLLVLEWVMFQRCILLR